MAIPFPGTFPDRGPRSHPAGLRNTEVVTATGDLRAASSVGARADLDRVREAVAAALEDFLARQRAVLAAMDETLEVVVDELCELARGGKRLRPLFAYWGWRGGLRDAPGPAEDDAAVLRAVAALEFVHASALVHDDVMDGATTRRGRAATHVAFAARHGDEGLSGDKELFGTGAAILVGDLALVWSDELLRASGISVPALVRARPVWDTMRTEVTAGQYLDLLRAGGGLPGPDGAVKVARYKSAGYTVQRPLLLGAALAGAGEAVRTAYTAVGLPLGEAFQLRDDVLGVFGDSAETGKPTSWCAAPSCSRPAPASPVTTTCARASRPCWSRWPSRRRTTRAAGCCTTPSAIPPPARSSSTRCAR